MLENLWRAALIESTESSNRIGLCEMARRSGVAATRVDRNCLRLFAACMNLTAKALLGALFFSAFAAAQAQLAWEKTEIELHPKPGDADAVATFKYENKGDKPVKITSVKSSCGCTVPALKKDEVAPGEKGELTATFTIGNRTGAQQKSVTVQTDDPLQPVTNLILKATIAQAITIQPTFVYWENGEAIKPKRITVKAGLGVTVTKVDVTSSSPEFTTKVEKGAAAGEFIINVLPKDTSRQLATTLTIKSDLPQMFYATARVTGPAAAAAAAAARP